MLYDIMYAPRIETKATTGRAAALLLGWLPVYTPSGGGAYMRQKVRGEGGAL